MVQLPSPSPQTIAITAVLHRPLTISIIIIISTIHYHHRHHRRHHHHCRLSGCFTLRIALITDVFHTIFDCMVLVLSVYCMSMSRRVPDSVFSFGYTRLEVISGFTTACFLLFLGLFTLMEGVHEYFTDAHHEWERTHTRTHTHTNLNDSVGMCRQVLYWQESSLTCLGYFFSETTIPSLLHMVCPASPSSPSPSPSLFA